MNLIRQSNMNSRFYRVARCRRGFSQIRIQPTRNTRAVHAVLSFDNRVCSVELVLPWHYRRGVRIPLPRAKRATYFGSRYSGLRLADDGRCRTRRYPARVCAPDLPGLAWLAACAIPADTRPSAHQQAIIDRVGRDFRPRVTWHGKCRKKMCGRRACPTACSVRSASS